MNFFVYLVPLLVIFPIVANLLANRFPKSRLSLLQFWAPITFFSLTCIIFINGQSLELFLGETSYFRFGFRLDGLSGLIATTVSTIGIVVTRFSVKYLEDDPKKSSFFNNLSFTLSFVLLMLMSSNLLFFFLTWVCTSYFLHQLLTHFSSRPAALKAAAQKFWVSRVGDFFIIIAGFLFVYIFKSLEFSVIFESLENPFLIKEKDFLMNVCSIFLVLGAMTKSAQFPFHYWLPNTMETPTPVSAIMHAGIINAGGYLVIRMSPFLTKTPFALSLLALVGGLTAFLGMIVMFTQSNIKRNLAYSTISQMGFMMLQCGLGAFSIAVVHILGHAFYKAYAFLSSSTVTDYGKLNRYFPKATTRQPLWAAPILAACTITIVFGFCTLFGHDILKNSGTSVLLVILSLAISQIIMVSKNKMKGILSAGSITILYLVLSKAISTLLSGTVASGRGIESSLGVFVLILSISLFVGLYLIQNNLQKISETEIGKLIYVKSLRGRIL